MWSSSRRYAQALISAAAAVASVGAAMAAEDLAALRVDPQRGQSADQLRRDRYECHNWAVEQTGQTPVAPSEDDRDRPSDSKRDKRAERANRAILGAAIGSVVGGIAGSGRGWRHENDAVLTGAEVRLRANGPSRVMVVGGEPLGRRHIWWNFVSSSKERIEQAKRDWTEGRMGKVPGDDEFIPLPDR